MAATPQEVLQQIDSAEPAILRVFLEEVAQLADDASVTRIAELVQTGNVAQILAALGFDAAAFSVLVEAVRSVYADGGGFEAREFPVLKRPSGGTFRLRFDIRNPRAESWLRDHSSRLVTAITEQQREGIQAVVADGTRLGRNPRATALDLVGRVSKETGRRVGGVIGLTSKQTQYVLNARRELLSIDSTKLQNYLDRKRRDRRFDAIVAKAIREEKAISMATVDRITARYADRLLKLRGENIARTEALTAFSAGREEAFAQAIDMGVKPENVTGTWRDAGDGRVRHTHHAMNGQKRPWGQPFVSPSGARLMYPGDTSLGAGAEEIVGCRCVKMVRIDHIAEAMRG